MPATAAAKQGDLLRISEVAKILKYSPKYVIKLIDHGRLPALDLTVGGNRKRRTLRVEAAEVNRFRSKWPPAARKRTVEEN